MTLKMYLSRRHKIVAGVAAMGVSAGLVFALAGCGGGSSPAIKDASASTITTRATGTFYTEADQITGPRGTSRLGRSFVELKDGIPQRVGFELADAAIDNQTPTPITDEDPNIYFVPLPPEASATCYKQLAVFYFSGHPIDQYRPAGEPKHFHTVFLLNAPVQPSQGLQNELVVAAPEEIPTGVLRGVPDVVVPGVGVSYDDPTKPAGLPARVTVGQNYLYYNGHMNGVVLGENVSFLRSGNTFSDVVTQPQVYPRPAYYPTRCAIRYDGTRNVHIYEMTNFIPATQSRSVAAK